MKEGRKKGRTADVSARAVIICFNKERKYTALAMSFLFSRKMESFLRNVTTSTSSSSSSRSRTLTSRPTMFLFRIFSSVLMSVARLSSRYKDTGQEEKKPEERHSCLRCGSTYVSSLADPWPSYLGAAAPVWSQDSGTSSKSCPGPSSGSRSPALPHVHGHVKGQFCLMVEFRLRL